MTEMTQKESALLSEITKLGIQIIHRIDKFERGKKRNAAWFSVLSGFLVKGITDSNDRTSVMKNLLDDLIKHDHVVGMTQVCIKK